MNKKQYDELNKRSYEKVECDNCNKKGERIRYYYSDGTAVCRNCGWKTLINVKPCLTPRGKLGIAKVKPSRKRNTIIQIPPTFPTFPTFED